ncbi:SNF2-related protein [Microcoleus asticus]|nr:SNF2-related protein [Microcoleus asticus]
MPVNLLNEQVYYEHGGNAFKDCIAAVFAQTFTVFSRFAVAANFQKSFLIADEVGLGKNIETGLILRYLLISQKVKPVLILAPASIQPQWHEELREKFNLHFWSYSKGELKNSYGESIQSGEENIWNCQNLILASSHLVRRSDRPKQLLDAQP